MNFNKLSVALILILSPMLVQAQNIFDLDTTEKRWYWGMHIGQIKEAELDTGMIVFGYDLSNWMAIEAHVGKTNKISLTDPSGDFLDFGTDYVAAAFVRFNLRYDRVTWYAMAGAGTVKFSGNYDITNAAAEISSTLGNFLNTAGLPATGSFDESINAAAYGGGLEFYGSRNTALTLNWIRYFDDNDVGALTVVSLGFIHHFDWPRGSKRY